MSAEEQTVSTPITSDEQLQSSPTDGKSTNESTTSVVFVDESSSNPTSPSMIQQVTQLLQAQRDMMAVQVEAIATNSVPPLKMCRMVALIDGLSTLKTGQMGMTTRSSHLEKMVAHVVRMMSSEE